MSDPFPEYDTDKHSSKLPRCIEFPLSIPVFGFAHASNTVNKTQLLIIEIIKIVCYHERKKERK